MPDKNFNHFWTHTIYKVFEDSQNNLWLGTGKFGVARLNPDRTKADYFINNAKDLNSLYGTTYFRAIEEDQYGRIWIGSVPVFARSTLKQRLFLAKSHCGYKKLG